MYVKCCRSKKTGNLFVGLYKHLPYTELLITIQAEVIAEFLEVPIARIRTMKEGEVIEVK